MISGFSSAQRPSYGAYDSSHDGNLPVPFNIPMVLYNLLFEDIDLKFDAKQSDMLEALRFSYKALFKLQEISALKEQEVIANMLRNPDNIKYKEEHNQIQLDLLQANQHFKELVIVMSDLLTREQYAKLLKFCNINI